MNRSVLSACLIVFAALVFAISSIGLAIEFYQLPYDDLPTYYYGVHMALLEHVSPYDYHHYTVLGNQLGRKLYPYLYPPQGLLIFAPMLLTEQYPVTKLSFSILNLLAWWCITYCFYRLFCLRASVTHSAQAAIICLIASAICVPIHDVLRTGQVDLLVLMLLMPVLFSFLTGKYHQGVAVCLVLALFLKVYLLLIVPILVIYRQWKLLRMLAYWACLLTIVSILVLPAELWRDWIELIRSSGYGKQIPNMITIPWNLSLNGICIRSFIGMHLAKEGGYLVGFIYMLSGAILALAMHLCIDRKQFQDGLFDSIAVILLVVNLIAPLTWLHHLVFSLPAFVLLLSIIVGGFQAGRRLAMLVAAFVTFLTICRPGLAYFFWPNYADPHIVDNHIPWQQNLLWSMPTLGLLLQLSFLACLIYARADANKPLQ